MTSTADVRPISGVIRDLRRLLVCELDGAATHPGHMAAWSVLGECQERISMAEMIAEDRDPEESTYRLWIAHGERMTATGIIRKLADAYGVSNFR
jgi:hypothetical protein